MNGNKNISAWKSLLSTLVIICGEIAVKTTNHVVQPMPTILQLNHGILEYSKKTPKDDWIMLP